MTRVLQSVAVVAHPVRLAGQAQPPQRRPPDRHPALPLAIVSFAFVLAEILVITPQSYLSWDEALYVSQLSAGAPAMGMDAHRSLGVPLLVAPISAITTSVAAIRVYLSVLTGVALFLAYRPWLRYGGPPATLAALLFASLGVTFTNGNVALPNLFIAFAAVAGTGCFLLCVQRPGTRRPLIGLAAAFTVLSLLRPTDAVWVALPLLAGAGLVPSWRRRGLRAVAAIGGGLGAGGLVWLVEAYARFGGPLERMAMLREITEAGNGPVLFDEAAALGRRLVEGGWDGTLVAGLLPWPVATGLLILGLWRARRTPTMPGWTLAAVTGAATAGPYLLLLSYLPGRYLLPGAALLAFPVAGGVHRVLTAGRRQRRSRAGALLAGAAAAVLVAHVGAQLWAARTATEHSSAARRAVPVAAERLRDAGLRPPCFVSGSFAPQVAYVARCSANDVTHAARQASVEIGSWQERHPESVPALTEHDIRVARRDGRHLAVVARSGQRPAHLAGWPRVRLLADRPWYAYFPPSSPPSPFPGR